MDSGLACSDFHIMWRYTNAYSNTYTNTNTYTNANTDPNTDSYRCASQGHDSNPELQPHRRFPDRMEPVVRN